MTTDVRPLRWAIAGPGAIARDFAQSLAASGAGSVQRVTGRSIHRAQSFCDTFGGTVAVSLQEVLDDPEVDALYVSTPHTHHAAAVAPALDAGKAVLCEKPLCVEPETAERLFDRAARTGTPLVEAWMYRLHPQIARALELVHDEKAVGDLVRIRSKFCFDLPFDPEHRLYAVELGGGGILDVGGYPLSLAMHVAGSADAKLVDCGAELAPTGVDSTAWATLRFPASGAGGLEAEVRAAVAEDGGCTTELVGTAGKVVLDDPFAPGGDRHALQATLVVERAGQEPRTETLAARYDCYGLEAWELARMVAHGEREPRPPMVGRAESLAISRTLDAWRRQVGAAPAKDL